MIGAVKSILTSSNLASIAQNTTQSVAIETTLKSIFTSGNIEMDTIKDKGYFYVCLLYTSDAADEL